MQSRMILKSCPGVNPFRINGREVYYDNYDNIIIYINIYIKRKLGAYPQTRNSRVREFFGQRSVRFI